MVHDGIEEKPRNPEKISSLVIAHIGFELTAFRCFNTTENILGARAVNSNITHTHI